MSFLRLGAVKWLSCLSLFLVSTSPLVASAKDLGVHGKVWRVTEIDMRLLAMYKASQVDWDKKRDEWVGSVENKMRNMPYTVTADPAEELTIYTPVLETVVNKDIYIPYVDESGELVQKLLAKKGTRLNAFETMHTEEKFFYFNPQNKKQYDFALSMLRTGFLDNHQITPVATGGDMLQGFKDFDSRLRYAYPDVVSHQGVYREFTLVYHKQGEKNIRIVEFPEEVTEEMIYAVLSD